MDIFLNWEIGQSLFKLRKRKGISLYALSSGLISPSGLCKLEAGEKTGDIFLLTYLFGRLGKSADKIEYVLFDEEHTLLKWQYEIEKRIKKGAYEEASIILNNIEAYKIPNCAIWKQFKEKIAGFLSWKQKNDRKDAKEHLEKAIQSTIPQLKAKHILEEDLDGLRFCTEELRCILLLLLQYVEERKSIGREKFGIEKEIKLEMQIKKILFYGETEISDMEKKTRIIPQAIWVYGLFLIQKKNYKNLIKWNQKAYHILIENNVLVCLPEIMEQRIVCMKGMKIDCGNLKDILEYSEILKKLFEHYEIKEYNPLLFINRQSNFYLGWEMIRKSRIANGISQEELAEGICTQETLSRIENRKHKPGKEKFAKLAERLGIQRNGTSFSIRTDQFEILEIQQQINFNIMKRNYDKAYELFCQWKKLPLKKEAETSQYFELVEMIIQNKREAKTAAESMKAFRHSLSYTLKGYPEVDLEQCSLSCQETIIFENICNAYHSMGEREKAAEILRKLIKNYESSKLELIFRPQGISMIYLNLGLLENQLEQLDSAINLYCKGLFLQMESGRIGGIGKMIANYINTKRKLHEEEFKKEEWILKYHTALLLCRLSKDKETIEAIKEYCCSEFNIDMG